MRRKKVGNLDKNKSPRAWQKSFSVLWIIVPPLLKLLQFWNERIWFFLKTFPLYRRWGHVCKKILNLKHCHVFTQPYHHFRFCCKYKIIAEIVGWPHIIQNWIRGQNAFNQSSPWWPWEWYFVHGHIITGYLQNISKRSKYLQLQAKFVNGIALLRPLSNYRICCLCRKNSRIFISITPEHTHLPIAYKLVWQKKKITLWLLFQCASRNVRLTGRERTCGPNHSTAFLPRFGLTVDFIFWFMFALKVWIITNPHFTLIFF